MSQLVATRLASLRTGPAERSAGITVFPLLGEAPAPVDYQVLEEALAAGAFVVREKSEAGVVGELVVENRGERPVLLLDGEFLLGGKQNRIVNASVLVGAGVTTTIPVSCVEQGRWNRGSVHRTAPFHAPHRVRTSVRRSSTRGLRAHLSARSDQGEVWDDVGEILACAGSQSPSDDLARAFEDRAAELRDFATSLTLPEDAVGILVAAGDRFVAGDVFDRRETMNRYRHRLLMGAAMDRVARRGPTEPGNEVTDAEAAAFLASLADGGEEDYPTPGLGREVRSESRRALVSALAFEECVIHLGIHAGG